MSLKGLNEEKIAADPVTFEDLATSMTANYETEGILTGLTVTETSPASTSVTLNAGKLVINLGGQSKSVFYTAGSNYVLADNTASTYNLIVAKIDQTNATSTIEVLAGTSGGSTDPDLTEASGIYYLPLARITANGGNVSNSDITQDALTLTNNANPEIIGAYARTQPLMTPQWFQLSDLELTFNTDIGGRVYSLNVNKAMTDFIRPGNRIRFSNNSNTVYGIIHKVEATLIYVFVKASSSVTNSAITDIYFSKERFPVGFSEESDDWSVNDGFSVSSGSGSGSITLTTTTVGLGKYYREISFNYTVTDNDASTDKGMELVDPFIRRSFNTNQTDTITLEDGYYIEEEYNQLAGSSNSTLVLTPRSTLDAWTISGGYQKFKSLYY